MRNEHYIQAVSSLCPLFRSYSLIEVIRLHQWRPQTGSVGYGETARTFFSFTCRELRGSQEAGPARIGWISLDTLSSELEGVLRICSRQGIYGLDEPCIGFGHRWQRAGGIRPLGTGAIDARCYRHYRKQADAKRGDKAPKDHAVTRSASFA